MSNADAVLARLRSASSLAVVCHDDPDPDSLSSAIALERLARESGVDTVDILYGGTISHQQNRAFVDLFDVTPTQYETAIVERSDAVAFVDHSLPGDHNPVLEHVELDVVVDHHPSDRPVPAAVVDVREEYGATATILAEYFRESHVDVTPRIASALLFGIHRERLDFYRQPTDREYDVANYLHSRADPSLLRELYGASFMPGSVDAFGDVIRNRVRRGTALVSCIGRLENKVALAQAADFLCNVDGVDTVLVCGIVRDELHLSGRTSRMDLDLAATLSRLFDGTGSVGGHSDMAGGQLPLEAIVDADGGEGDGADGRDPVATANGVDAALEELADDVLVAAIRRRIERRFFETIDADPTL